MTGDEGASGQGTSGSRGGSMHSSGQRQDWGQLMPLSPVGGALPEHLSRSNSEDWELLPEKAAFPCDSRPRPTQPDDEAADEVQVRLVSDAEDAVRVSITPTSSPLPSPRHADTPPLEAADAAEEASDVQPFSAAANADGESASPSPLSGSAHSFEHLSDHFAPPSFGSDGDAVSVAVSGGATFGGSDGEAVEAAAATEAASVADAADNDSVPSPPSLPDLEALPEHESDGGSLASSAAGGNGSEVSCLEASFAEQLQLAAAGLGGGVGAAASVASSGINASGGASHAASPLGSSYSDLAASDLAASAASGGGGLKAHHHPGQLQAALARLEAGNQEIIAAAAEQEPGPDPETGLQQDEALAVEAVGTNASFYASLKSYMSSHMPSAAFSRLWETLQDWSRGVYKRMPALPQQLAQPAAFMGKRLRRLDWQRAALGASVASVAVLSFLLYSSYATNRRLRAALGRKETDLLQLISRVVSLQRDMLRPRAVPIIRHTSAGACSWPAMDII